MIVSNLWEMPLCSRVSTSTWVLGKYNPQQQYSENDAILSLWHVLVQTDAVLAENASATIQQIVEIVLSSVMFKFALVYIDFIIIFSRSIYYHFGYLSTVLSLMKNVAFSAKNKKCNFSRRKPD